MLKVTHAAQAQHKIMHAVLMKMQFAALIKFIAALQVPHVTQEDVKKYDHLIYLWGFVQ